MRRGGRRSNSRARGHSSSSSSSWGWAVLKLLSVAAISLTCALLAWLLVAYSLPSLRLIYTELLPRLQQQVLTPRNLFLLLNLLIFSIVGLAHLHRHQQQVASPRALDTVHLHGHHQHQPSASVSSSAPPSAAPFLSPPAHRMEEAMEVDDHHRHQRVQSSTTTHPFREDGHDDNGGDSDDSGGGSDGYHDDIDGDHNDDNDGGRERGVKIQREEQEEAFLNAPSYENPPNPSSSKVDSLSPHHLSQFILPNPPFLASTQGPFAPMHDRPLPSARFTHKKQLSRASPSDRSYSPLRISRTSPHSHSPLRISRSPAKRVSTPGDTLDATWRAICEKKHGLAPHHYRHHAQISSRSSSIENLQDTSNVNTSSSLVETKPHAHSRLRRREPSINREELNKKVESFISRFNQQIRLQRQESLLRYKEMANKGPLNES